MAVDRLCFAYFLLVAAAVLAGWTRVPAAAVLAAVNAAIACAWLFAVPRLVRRDFPLGRVLVALPTVVFAYTELAWIVPHLNPARYGAALRQADIALFGADPAAVLGRHQHPALTELLQIVYATFYLLPLILAVSLHRRRLAGELRFCLDAIVLGFFVSYVGYALVPAVSPHYFVVYDDPLEGLWLFDSLRGGLDRLAPRRLDCFPSGHTEITVLLMALSARFARPLFWRFFLPWGTLLVFSTVYLRYHYVVDVLAGIALVPPVLLGARALGRADCL